MSLKFKKGDIVRALHGTFNGQFTKGRTYTVVESTTPGSSWTSIEKDDSGNPNGWSDRMFELVKSSSLSPVRSVTAYKIESGTYGNLRVVSMDNVANLEVGVGFVDATASYNAAGLRLIIGTLTELAEALESRKKGS